MNGCRLKFWTKVHHLPSSLVETGTWRQCKGSLFCFVCSLAHVDLCNTYASLMDEEHVANSGWYSLFSLMSFSAECVFVCVHMCSLLALCVCVCVCVRTIMCVRFTMNMNIYIYGYYCFFVWLYYTIDFYVGICTVHVFLKLGCKALWVSESTL